MTSPIRDARIRLGMSRDELGRILGVSGRTVSYWESGGKLPDKQRARALRDTLCLSEVDLWRAMHRRRTHKNQRLSKREEPW